MWVNRRPAEEPAAQLTPALSVDSINKPSGTSRTTSATRRRQHAAPWDPPRGEEGQRQRLPDGHERSPEVAVGGEGRDDGVGRPAEPGGRVHLADAPDEEEAGRAHEQERQRVPADILRELDVERVDREQQPGEKRDAPAEQRACQHDHHPQRSHGEDHRQAPERDLTVAEDDPAAEQQVVERHVGLAVRDGVGEEVPGRGGQGGADGFVEEQAVGAQEQRPENRSQHQLRDDSQPPLLCCHRHILLRSLLRRWPGNVSDSVRHHRPRVVRCSPPACGTAK